MEDLTKEDIIKFIEKMPQNASIMDVIYELYVKFILLDRLANIKEEDFIDHKDVMKQLRDRFIIGKQITYHDAEEVVEKLKAWLKEREFPSEFAKNFMYLGSTPYTHQFKNINTNEYLEIKIK